MEVPRSSPRRVREEPHDGDRLPPRQGWLADSAAAALSVSVDARVSASPPAVPPGGGAYARPVTEIEPTEEIIASLLRHPDCPQARVLRSEDKRFVPVAQFILFARSRGVATTELEERTDAYVERIGGRRENVIDPWTAIPNLVRRVVGALESPPEYLWVLPPPSGG